MFPSNNVIDTVCAPGPGFPFNQAFSEAKLHFAYCISFGTLLLFLLITLLLVFLGRYYSLFFRRCSSSLLSNIWQRLLSSSGIRLGCSTSCGNIVSGNKAWLLHFMWEYCLWNKAWLPHFMWEYCLYSYIGTLASSENVISGDTSLFAGGCSIFCSS